MTATTPTTDVAAFIVARLDEDEAAARDAIGATVEPDWGPQSYRVVTAAKFEVAEASVPSAAHIARHDPARVLAQVAAMRKIVELHPPRWREVHHPRELGSAELRTERGGGPFYDDELYALAAIWADHDEYGRWAE